eukprot:scaffold10011_cov97-Isochrysis_galbana.AAC.7
MLATAAAGLRDGIPRAILGFASAFRGGLGRSDGAGAGAGAGGGWAIALHRLEQHRHRVSREGDHVAAVRMEATDQQVKLLGPAGRAELAGLELLGQLGEAGDVGEQQRASHTFGVRQWTDLPMRELAQHQLRQVERQSLQRKRGLGHAVGLAAHAPVAPVRARPVGTFQRVEEPAGPVGAGQARARGASLPGAEVHARRGADEAHDAGVGVDSVGHVVPHRRREARR